jgi:hypothetical protein
MALTPEQHDELAEIYANRVVDNMDAKSMEKLLFDMLLDSYSSQSEWELEELILATDGQEYYDGLVQSVTNEEG